ncbi:hypothetical protein KP509_28G055600 [Ceratopteris richardii]|uniref:Chromophore lyase CRL, chloroplastic n=1 Tax=Ceratopteris richardii TaxID=49495 RepID=A0A8T2RE60_CERRI|nr:hypothetical protein KP509_28G055600 [Ceratopteris richardii]
MAETTNGGGNQGRSGSNVNGGNHNNGGRIVRSLVVKSLCALGAAFLLRKLTKTTTRWDHSRAVAEALSGEKYSTEQAARDPMTFFNLRMLTCPATVLADGSRVLYFEQGFGRNPEKPYRQRFFKVKPCPNEMKCDVEVGSYAVRDVEEYRNFCDRPKNQRPQPEEVIGDMAEHLTSVYLTRCRRGQRCLYEGSTPTSGFPNEWNGASYCTSDLSILRNGEVHLWDRGYDEEGNQVWGVKEGPYEFKPSSSISFNTYHSSELLDYGDKRFEEASD